MSTVRIYKVAELLNTSSQEVTALLKKMGIDVKSASSTIEEVVARQFVDRLARERNISLPGGDIFAETPAPKGGAKKGGPPPKKGPEPVPAKSARSDRAVRGLRCAARGGARRCRSRRERLNEAAPVGDPPMLVGEFWTLGSALAWRFRPR